MIYDNIKNAKIYYNLHPDIKVGLQYLERLTKDVPLGEYKISDSVKAIVSEYETVKEFSRGFEAHKHVIDIQFPIIGRERVKWSNIEGMKINIPYDEQKDRTFYKNPMFFTYVDIGEGFFAIMFPQDGHSPQHFIEKPEIIKKVTIKVKIDKSWNDTFIL
jgi:YhcH/YjgK/YiaL family protein